jgi:hypothetical protein
MAKMEVRYVGTTADFRGLTEADLKGWGISLDLPAASPLARQYVQDNTWCEPLNRPLDPSKDLVWGPHNQHRLVLDVSPELESLLRAQGHFLLSEVTDEGATREVAPPTDIEHPGDEQTASFGDERQKQRSSTVRETNPSVVERPDPAWEAMQAREAAGAEQLTDEAQSPQALDVADHEGQSATGAAGSAGSGGSTGGAGGGASGGGTTTGGSTANS